MPNDHYYTPAPQSAHDLRRVVYHVAGRALQLDTDAGVFSKEGVDFGSRLLVDCILECLPPAPFKLLDLGCGYGPIGLAVAACAQCEVWMTDINERAVALARQNARTNRLQVTIHQQDGCQGLGPFDMVALNPPIRAGKDTVYRLFDQAHASLNPGGGLMAVIRKQQGAPSAMTRLETLFGNCSRLRRDSGYWILSCTKQEDCT